MSALGVRKTGRFELAATIAHQAVQVADLMKAMRRIEPA